MPAAGQSDADGIEQGAFNEDGGGGFVAARRLPADNAGDGLHPGGVADGAVFGGDGVVLAVQCPHRFTRATAQGQRIASQLADIEHMQRAAEVEGKEIRHIHQRIDRAQADGRKPILQPFRAGGVADVADGAADNPGAGIQEIITPDRPTFERGGNLRRCERLQCPEASRREIARHAADGETIAAVRRHPDLDDRIVQASPCRVGHAHRRVGRQVHDSSVIVAQPHFAGGHHHALTFHAADFADFQCDTGTRYETAR